MALCSFERCVELKTEEQVEKLLNLPEWDDSDRKIVDFVLVEPGTKEFEELTEKIKKFKRDKEITKM